MKQIEPTLAKRQHPVYRHLWASNDGRVFSAYRGLKCLDVPVSEVQGCRKTSGHRAICVKADQGYVQVTVAQIVWECFFGPLPEHLAIDHINNNPADTRLENLRRATQAQVTRNSRIRKNNKSGYKGVSYDQKSGRYQAKITTDRQQTHLGRFLSARKAALAYDRAAVRLHGEFARTNCMLGLL